MFNPDGDNNDGFLIDNENSGEFDYLESIRYPRRGRSSRSFKGKTNEVLSSLIQSTQKDSAILPHGVVWVSRDRSQMVVTEDPRMRNITARFARAPECSCVWSEPDENGDDELIEQCGICQDGVEDGNSIEDSSLSRDDWASFWVYVPRVVYYFSVSDSYISLHKILCTLDDTIEKGTPLSTLPLPNLYKNGGTCGGNTGMEAYRHNKEVSLAINSCIDAFWSSAFNYDIQEFRDTRVWEELVKNVTKYWEDAEVFRYWESLTLEEVYFLLPWKEDVQENFLESEESVSSIIGADRHEYYFFRHIASIIYQNSTRQYHPD